MGLAALLDRRERGGESKWQGRATAKLAVLTFRPGAHLGETWVDSSNFGIGYHI